MFIIATDGACKGNPGPGGWAFVVFNEEGDQVDYRFEGHTDTTNNRMELLAFINACEYIRDTFEYGENVIIKIDSTYVLKGSQEWLNGWVSKNYKNVKNEDLWRIVESLRPVWSRCTMQWVKGHSGDFHNELADRYANVGCESIR